MTSHMRHKLLSHIMLLVFFFCRTCENPPTCPRVKLEKFFQRVHNGVSSFNISFYNTEEEEDIFLKSKLAQKSHHVVRSLIRCRFGECRCVESFDKGQTFQPTSTLGLVARILGILELDSSIGECAGTRFGSSLQLSGHERTRGMSPLTSARRIDRSPLSWE